MEYQATLVIICRSAKQVAHFRSVEEAKAILERFAVQLAKIKEFSNRDEDPIFRFEGAGALYAVDLRHAVCAAVELNSEMDKVVASVNISKMEARRTLKGQVEERDLNSELDEMERLYRAA